MQTLIVFPLIAAVLLMPSSKLQLIQAPDHPVHTFEQRWEPVYSMPPMVDMSKKADRIDPRLLDPRVIRTIPITRENEAQSRPHEAATEPEKEPEPRGDVQGDVRLPVPAARPHVRKVRTVSLGLCERHGMRKMVTNGGRSWRCRR